MLYGSDTMNIETAKNKIINHNVKIEKEKQKKEQKRKTEEKKCLEKIKKLQPRIKQIIEIGNLCIENNIFIGHKPCSDKRTYKEKCFETEGIKHQLGFYPNNMQGYPVYKCLYYDYIGIINGGFCGDWDFLINDKEILEIKQEKDKHTPALDHTSTYRKPTIRQMTKFLNQFDEFEREFYKFIENL